MRALIFLPCLWIAVCAGGCASHDVQGCRGVQASPTSEGLEIVDRTAREVDVAQVKRLPQVDQVLGFPHPPGNYRALGPAECQCLAARASKLGNLLDGERRALAANESAGGGCSRTDNSLTYDVLRTAALEARNRSAGDALNAYYLLAQNEARIDLVTRALAETRQATANIERLRQQGLKMPAEDDRFLRREIELRDQQAQLGGAISQLNAQLWQLIGLEPTPPQERIWPTERLEVVVERIDVDEAVQNGLAMRPELSMLRRLRRTLDEDSLPAARAALAQVSPLLGLAPQSSGCGGLLGLVGALRKLHTAERELPERRRQLNQYAHDRELEVAAEIRLAAETVELRLRQIAIAKESLDHLTARRGDAEARAKSSGATFADLTAAHLAVIQAEGDVIEKVAAWKIAQARLKQSQGLLVAECCP
ncbi:MAG TPA: hypothetical protein VGG64_01865 [Pirellulales bacterium]|jgi:hypothetical protein